MKVAKNFDARTFGNGMKRSSETKIGMPAPVINNTRLVVISSGLRALVSLPTQKSRD